MNSQWSVGRTFTTRVAWNLRAEWRLRTQTKPTKLWRVQHWLITGRHAVYSASSVKPLNDNNHIGNIHYTAFTRRQVTMLLPIAGENARPVVLWATELPAHGSVRTNKPMLVRSCPFVCHIFHGIRLNLVHGAHTLYQRLLRLSVLFHHLSF
jgi:hypothetical protein